MSGAPRTCMVAIADNTGDPVCPYQDHIDHTVLHQVAAGVVRDHGVRNSVLAKLPSGERGALVARARLVDPYVDRGAAIVGHVDWRQGGAEIDSGKPARVAVREHLRRVARPVRRDCANQVCAMATDRLLDGANSTADFGCAATGGWV